MKKHLSNKNQTAAMAAATPPLDLAAYHRSEKEKRPVEVEVGKLFLDPKNPRLAETSPTGTQASILRVMERDFDLQPLIDSMYRSGFFWEEPLVAVREPLAELKGKKALVVIEGNRRLAALKTILSKPDQFPDEAARKRLTKVPVIERDTREETLAFVGFRHITGIVPWEAAAKAQYAHGLVKGGHSLEEIALLIGDQTRDIARWVRTQSLVDRAHDLGLNEDDAAKQFYFSYLLTSTDAPATKRWLEMETNEASGLVTRINEERLKELWFWLYGSKSSETSPVVPESRQIHKLNRVIASPENTSLRRWLLFVLFFKTSLLILSVRTGLPTA
ncbi:MAG: hypothetical protein NTW03_07520 [Verrucomicrobia bacterium]|nr:hypothetical protein [Verrucomicrobiota bacterium]